MIIYKERVALFLKRQDIFEDNLKKAYSMIYGNYCTKAMQHRVQELPKFRTKIKDDPIQLLKAIKSLTHDIVRAQ